MMELAFVLQPFLIPLLVGYAALNAIFTRNPLSPILTAGISFGLGMGIITQWMLILGFFGLPYDPVVIHAPLFIVVGTVCLWKRRAFIPGEDSDVKALPSEQGSVLYRLAVILCGAYLAVQVFYILSYALTVPVFSWDAIYFIAKKAKVFFYDQSMRHLPDFPWAFYPFYATLAKTWHALCLGEWHEVYVKAVFPLTFVAFAAIVYGFLRRYVDRLSSLMALLLMTTSNLFLTHAVISYSDLSLLYFMNTSILLLILWKESGQGGLLVLASLFAGFCTFTKLEGLVYFGISGLLLAATLWKDTLLRKRQKVIRFLQFLLPGACIYGIFLAYKAVYHIPAVGRLWIERDPDLIGRFPVILGELSRNLLVSNNWGLVWFLFFVSTLIAFGVKKPFPLKFLSAFIMLFAGFLVGLGLFTSNYHYLFGKESYVSLSRLILHIFPLAVILLVLQLKLWLDLKRT